MSRVRCFIVLSSMVLATTRTPAEPSRAALRQQIDQRRCRLAADSALDVALPWTHLAYGATALSDEGALAYLATTHSFALLGADPQLSQRVASELNGDAQLQELADEKAAIADTAAALNDDWQSVLAQFAIDAARARSFAAAATALLTPQQRHDFVEPLQTGALPQVSDSLPLDVTALDRAAITLLVAVDALLAGLPVGPDSAAFTRGGDEVDGPVIGPIHTRAGDLYIGGRERNVWRLREGLIIDLGGDDLYEMPGATPSIAGGAALVAVIDIGGSDLYRAIGPGAIGAGWFGISLLRDLAGDDRYEGEALTQGAGCWGVGMLLDGGGNDRYSAQRAAQGFGAYGLGLLVDADGDDRFAARGSAQGYGAAGGVGLLFDRSGHDELQLIGPADTADAGGQGAARGAVLGVGLLLDGGGDDLRVASGQAQGFGDSAGRGLLIDVGGDDRTLALDNAQGAARRGGTGLLLDLEGLDDYVQTDADSGPTPRDTGCGVTLVRPRGEP